MSKKDAYIAKMKLQLEEVNNAMDALGHKAHEAKVEAKEKYDEEMAKLRTQSKQVVAKLDEMKDASEDKWEEMVGGVEKVRDAFVHSFHYFKAQLKN